MKVEEKLLLVKKLNEDKTIRPEELGIYGIIYLMTSPSNKWYFGQTVQSLQQRIFGHYSMASKNSYYMANCLKKYKKDDLVWEVVDVAEDEISLSLKEVWYIDAFNSRCKGIGYNSKGGGSNGKLSESHKQAIRQANAGKRASPETIQKLRISHLGRKASEETRRKMSLVQTGRPGKKKSEEEVKRLKEAIANSPNKQIGKSHYASKRVLCTETGEVFHGASEAQRLTGVLSSGISKVCRGLVSTAGGYHWEFTDQPATEKPEKTVKRPYKKKAVFCLTLNRPFSTLTEAGKATGIERHRISNACDGDGYAGGLQWKML